MTFHGEKLRIARTFHGLTQAGLGEKVAVGAPFVSRLESGRQEPSESLLDAISCALGFEIIFFLSPLEDPFQEQECHLRHRRTTPKKIKERVLSKGSLVAQLVGYLASVLEFPELSVPNYSAGSFDEIEEAAESAREHWDLGLDGPITNTIRVVENAGILTVRLEQQTDKIEAFSRYGKTSIIVLTSDKESASRSRYDVCHELGHLILHRGQVTGDKETEKQANHFAGAFLLPRGAFAREFRQMPRSDWAHVFELKRRWKASVAAIVVRAHQLKLIDSAQYRRCFKYISAKGWRRGEPFEPEIEQPELLRLAFLELKAETGEGLREVGQNLGWSPEVVESVTGLEVPALPSVSMNNVTQIELFRKRRTQEDQL